MMVYCPNYNCQAPNSEDHQFCERCQMPLPKRYLWAIGQHAETIAPGQILADRYQCKAPRIFLDTRPGLPPASLSQFPPYTLPYLRLAAYQLHVPQAYGWVQVGATNAVEDLLMLVERAAIATPARRRAISGRMSASEPMDGSLIQPLPALSDRWSSASAMRQLNWLWQLAKLWQPLATEQVVSALLDPELIRVEDDLIRLLELRLDQRDTQGVGASLLSRLGHVWAAWVPHAKPDIRPFLEVLCDHLVAGRIQHPGQLVTCLDRALSVAGQAQVRQISIATQSDRGPSRPRNEDACFPATPGLLQIDSRQPPEDGWNGSLVMVCDGIGGHLGGDVASGLAIDAFRMHLSQIPHGRLSPLTLITELRKATFKANDVISDRNDDENRRDRERMGTTLVTGLVQNHELYITHLGDSRAYWVTRWGCHQVTLDDDVASREARLGYGSYRSALYQPSAGALVQALGMGSSGSLHPTVQRLILDGEGVLLFCSDGLSDNDLVESTWQQLMLPLLDHRTNVATVAQQLIETANQYNGHDNVTVGLLQWSAQPASSFQLAAELANPPAMNSSVPAAAAQTQLQVSQGTTLQPSAQEDSAKTRLVAPATEPERSPQSVTQSDSRSVASLLLGILFLLGLSGVLAYILVPSVGDRVDALLGRGDLPVESPEDDALPPGESDSPSFDEFGDGTTRPVFQVGTVLEILPGVTSEGQADESAAAVWLQPEPMQRPLPAPTSTSGTNAPDGPSTPLPAPTSAAAPGAPATAETTPGSTPASPAGPGSEASTPGRITVPKQIPGGSILQILEQRENAQQGRWIRLRVCSTPTVTAANPTAGAAPTNGLEPLASVPSPSVSAESPNPGDIGWISEESLLPVAALDPVLTPEQLGGCSAQ